MALPRAASVAPHGRTELDARRSRAIFDRSSSAQLCFTRNNRTALTTNERLAERKSCEIEPFKRHGTSVARIKAILIALEEQF